MPYVIFILLNLICFFSHSNEIKLGRNYVNIEKLNVRELPSEKSKIIARKIYRQAVDVKEFQSGWARIGNYRLSNGKEDKRSEWVFSKYLVNIMPERPKSKYEANLINEHIIRTNHYQGRYFLVYIEKMGSTFVTIHQRIGINSSGYTKTEIRCSDMKFRVLDYTERHIEYFEFAEDKPSSWLDANEGSSKGDLVKYVCETRN